MAIELLSDAIYILISDPETIDVRFSRANKHLIHITEKLFSGNDRKEWNEIHAILHKAGTLDKSLATLQLDDLSKIAKRLFELFLRTQ